jgi:hypothetical protein
MRAALERAQAALTGPKPRLLNANGIGHLLSGLRGCSSASPLVSSVLAAVVPSIRAARSETFRARYLSMALYGLRISSSKHAAIRLFLTALAAKRSRIRRSRLAPRVRVMHSTACSPATVTTPRFSVSLQCWHQRSRAAPNYSEHRKLVMRSSASSPAAVMWLKFEMS